MASADKPSRRSPRSRIRPASAPVRPLITLKRVVLPAPFGPMSPVIVPSPTDSVQPASASTPPKRLVTSLTVRRSPVAVPPARRRSAPRVDAATYDTSSVDHRRPVRVARGPSGTGFDLPARVVVAGPFGDVGVVCGGERRDRLAVVACSHPCALGRGDDARRDLVGDAQRQMDLAEIVPDLHRDTVGEPARPRVVRMHLER